MKKDQNTYPFGIFPTQERFECKKWLSNAFRQKWKFKNLTVDWRKGGSGRFFTRNK